MTGSARFDEAHWERNARNWCAWWHGELERPMVVIEAVARRPDLGGAWRDHITGFPMSVSPEAVMDHYAAQLDGMLWAGDAFPRWWPNFGPGIIAAFLGSPVEASTGTTWFCPSGITSLAETELTYSPDNLWWERVASVTRAAVDRWGDRVVIGHTDLGGNLDILASLRGAQELLLDLHDAPDEVDRLARQITPLWLRYYGEFHRLVAATNRGAACWSPLWAPGTCYMLQSDLSYMISPRMFERLVLPDLLACCDALEYPFYHLDGKGEIKHLDILLSIARLRGIQWIPGDGAPPPEEWLPLLRRIRDGGKLCQLFVSPEGALKIARELGGKGFAFCLTGDDGFLTPEQAAACVEAFRAEGLLA